METRVCRLYGKKDLRVETAIELLSLGSISVKPLITDIFQMNAAHEALERATDRSRAVKVQIAF